MTGKLGRFIGATMRYSGSRGRCVQTVAASEPPDGLDRWPHFTSTRGVLRALDWGGTVVFAASGSIAAASAGFDVYGAVMTGCITAVGGGTLRDVLVFGRAPFWSGSSGEAEYLYLAAAGALVAFFAYPLVGASSWPDDRVPDAVALGAFAVIGAMNGVRAGLPPPLTIMCGVLTATGGGMVRDVLIRRPVRVLLLFE